MRPCPICAGVLELDCAREVWFCPACEPAPRSAPAVPLASIAAPPSRPLRTRPSWCWRGVQDAAIWLAIQCEVDQVFIAIGRLSAERRLYDQHARVIEGLTRTHAEILRRELAQAYADGLNRARAEAATLDALIRACRPSLN
jgi:hypothetical protein